MDNREKHDLANTTNNAYFNKLYKLHLDQCGDIACSYCGYNKGENRKSDYYGGRVKGEHNRENVKYPSWKLVSKKKKQWMAKPDTYQMILEKHRFSYNNWYWLEITF